MTRGRQLIGIVDDDESVRESLPDLVKEMGYSAQAYSSAEEFLASGAAEQMNCLILDIGLPGMSGHELRQRISKRGHAIPTIFITALAERSLPPGLLSDGQAFCLFKPFSDQDLKAALAAALKEN